MYQDPEFSCEVVARWAGGFMGGFGPSGRAFIVLGLVYPVQETHQPGESTIRLAVMATVWLSILARGLSAMPGIKRYAAA